MALFNRFLKTLKFIHILVRVGEIWRVAALTPDLCTPDEADSRDYSMIRSLEVGNNNGHPARECWVRLSIH